MNSSKTPTLIAIGVAVVLAGGVGAIAATQLRGEDATATTVAADSTAPATASTVPAGATTTTAGTPETTTATTVPTETTVPVETDELSEEELVAAIEAGTEEIVAAIEEVYVYVDDYASDGTVDEAESSEIYGYYAYAYEVYAEVEAYISVYYEVYGTYAVETVNELEEIEAYLASIDESLTSIDTILVEGAAATEEAVAALEAAATQATESAGQVASATQEWAGGVQSEREARITEALAVAPSEVFADRTGAITSMQTYVESLVGSFSDGTVSLPELDQISQAGANAVASLQGAGGGLEGLSSQITNVTGMLAGGDFPSVNASLPSLQASIPSIDISAPTGGGGGGFGGGHP